MTTLYAQDARGQTRTWSIEKMPDGLLMLHGVLNGEQQEKFEEINVGLASRSLDEQIESRFQSRINKKIDSGYCRSLQEATDKPRTNALGFQRPMLAQRFDKIKQIDYNDLYYQHKYDGNRMLITNYNGENIAYTRQGKVIESIPEILSEIVIPLGMTLDGEIYCHGETLQTIVSWVKRRQEDSKRLKFHAYDLIAGMQYKDRLHVLSDLDLGDRAEVVPTHKYDGKSTIKELLLESISSGYEGLILRQNDFGYENKRSKSLIKVKQFFDDEFKIFGVHLSKDDIPVLDCYASNGLSFKATAPGSMLEKEAIYNDRENVIGKAVHLEYSQLTKDGIPFHPTSICIMV